MCGNRRVKFGENMAVAGGNRCVYLNCDKNRRNYAGLKLYRFPVQEEMRDAWLNNCGNAEIATLSARNLRNRFVCQFHFKKEHFLPSRRLTKTAVPINFREMQESSQSPIPYSSPLATVTLKRKYEIECIPEYSHKMLKLSVESPESENKLSLSEEDNVLDEFLSFRCPSMEITKATAVNCTNTKKVSQMSYYLEQQSKLLTNKESQISKLRLSKRNYNVLQVFKSANYVSLQSKSIAIMQRHSRRCLWTQEEKELALSLFFSSPAAYRSMRRQKIILPDVITVKTWIGKCKYTPGFNKDLFQQILLKTNSMECKDKIIILSFGEMKIKQELEYSEELDMIEGLEDLGYLGRKDKPANQAMILMIKGLFSKWKLPIGYFLTESKVSKHNMISIIQKAIVLLKKCGLTVKAVMCDQSTTNMSVIKALGVTTSKPFFNVRNDKVFVIYDAPHLFENIRKNLSNGYFRYTNDTETEAVYDIVFDDIILAYNLDKRSETSKLLPKLTDIHINPNSFQRQQILSHSVASVINANIALGNITSKSAGHTAMFVDLMDKLFAILNSKFHSYRNPFKCSYSKTNLEHAHIITKAKELFKRLKKHDRKGNISRPPCFDGILQTLNALEQLHENMIKINSYILTSRLNQNCVEKLFAIIRLKRDYNPTAKMFRTRFKLNVMNNLIKPPSSANWKEGEDEFLDFNVPPPIEMSSIPDTEYNTNSETDSTAGSSTDASDFDDCTLAYFAAYICCKLIQKFHCECCENNILGKGGILDSRQQLLILSKTCAGTQQFPTSLRSPTRKIILLVTKIIKYFHKVYDSNKSIYNIKLRIKEHIFQNCDFNIICTDGNHQSFFLDLLLHTKFSKECKRMKSITYSGKRSQKLKILQNI